MASAPDPSTNNTNNDAGGNDADRRDKGVYNPYRRRAGRKLNVSGIKSVIVFVVGLLTALVGGLTGLGAQAAFAPMLMWMLGFAPEKAQGTAMSFGAWAAFAGALGAYAGGAAPANYLLRGAFLVVGAIAGALLTGGVARKMLNSTWRRASQGIGVALGMIVVVQVAHTSGLFAARPNLAEWQSLPALLLLGLGAGAVTQFLGLTSGALLVPVLYFGTGLHASNGSYAAPAVSLSLLAIALASALPAFAYSKRGLVDTVYQTPMVAAGVLGGFSGGLLLSHVQGRVVIMLSAIVAMFLCAREISRLAFASE